MFIPQRRDYAAKLNFAAVDNWNKKGKYVTHFMNSLSAYFPAGERFFLDSVRNYRDSVKHIPGILAAVNGFIGQEVMHGKMHDQYDAALDAKGYPAKKLEKLVEVALKEVQKRTSKKFQLALTTAAEHYTALMANYLLNSDIIDDAEDSYQELWWRHAIEEIEHRSVSYDVYDQVGDYSTRMVSYVIVSAILFPVFFATTAKYISKDKTLGVFDAKEFAVLSNVIVEMLVSMGPELVKYIHPHYHPDMMHVSHNFEKIKNEVFKNG